MSFWKTIYERFTKCKVYALVGASGTGKSFRSQLLAKKYKIDYIIDDGLLIGNNRIIAGKSAKLEDSFLKAVRRAVFDDKEHKDDVLQALKSLKPKKILILGTSEKMIRKISDRLELPPVHQIIRIEDIATKNDIETALRVRQIEGKHVIPVPSIEVKQNYPQIFYDKVRLLFKDRKKLLGEEQVMLTEKSVVRPEFSKTKTTEISSEALRQTLIGCIEDYSKGIVIKKIRIRREEIGYRIFLTIDIPFQNQLTGHIDSLKKYIIQYIEKYTGVLIEGVNIIIDKIIT